MKKFGLLYLACVFGVVAPAVAQTEDNTKPNNSQPSAPANATPADRTAKKTPEQKKPKRVWTNDEVGNLKGSVSVVGDKHTTQNRAVSEENEDNGGGDSRQDRIRQYRQAIDQLRAQIGSADARIAQLKNFKGENNSPSGGLNINGRYTMLPPEEQVKQLEAKKKQLQAKIDDLEVQAGKEGIEPGELR